LLDADRIYLLSQKIENFDVIPETQSSDPLDDLLELLLVS